MSKLKLLDQVRQLIRVKHYSLRTEEAYARWIKEYIFFHNKRHPAVVGHFDCDMRIPPGRTRRGGLAHEPRARGPCHL